jgi:hypothetical protein
MPFSTVFVPVVEIAPVRYMVPANATFPAPDAEYAKFGEVEGGSKRRVAPEDTEYAPATVIVPFIVPLPNCKVPPSTDTFNAELTVLITTNFPAPVFRNGIGVTVFVLQQKKLTDRYAVADADATLMTSSLSSDRFGAVDRVSPLFRLIVKAYPLVLATSQMTATKTASLARTQTLLRLIRLPRFELANLENLVSNPDSDTTSDLRSLPASNTAGPLSFKKISVLHILKKFILLIYIFYYLICIFNYLVYFA